MRSPERIIYLTLGEHFSGVMSSQVCDVCLYLEKELGKKVVLVSFVSLRSYWVQRKKFKKAVRKAVILPMFPGLNNWKRNTFLLRIVLRGLRPTQIMTRGILANNLVQKLKGKIWNGKLIYDGRGAYAAEWHEYDVVGFEDLIQASTDLEKQAVLSSDFRNAVSHQLVSHWENEFGYRKKGHVIIPCTLNRFFEAPLPGEDKRSSIRESHGYTQTDKIIVYAGSSAGWQSMKLLDGMLAELLQKDEDLQVLFLAKIDVENFPKLNGFGNRVKKMWLDPSKVYETLSICDYGLLVRENSITNTVASPTKFAEYLAAGLKVIISEQIGDYSALVREEKLGHVISSKLSLPMLKKVSLVEKQELKQFALDNFTKKALRAQYDVLVN